MAPFVFETISRNNKQIITATELGVCTSLSLAFKRVSPLKKREGTDFLSGLVKKPANFVVTTN